MSEDYKPRAYKGDKMRALEEFFTGTRKKLSREAETKTLEAFKARQLEEYPKDKKGVDLSRRRVN